MATATIRPRLTFRHRRYVIAIFAAQLERFREVVYKSGNIFVALQKYFEYHEYVLIVKGYWFSISEMIGGDCFGKSVFYSRFAESSLSLQVQLLTSPIR